MLPTRPRGIRAIPAYGERPSKGKLGNMLKIDPMLSPSMREDVIDYLSGAVERKAALEATAEKKRRDLAALEERVKLRDRLNKESMESRCKEAMETEPSWKNVTLQQVTDGANNVAKGMFYGLEFPWSEETLEKFGPEWLTTALHTAGTLAKDNRVVAINITKMKITAGNNGGKFLFEVRYARDDPELHTKLFAKVPFPMTPALKTDRLSSSVYKQPMDYAEINTYRLYEAALPFKTPKFYYGDISNETTNFILILERLDFACMGKDKRVSVKPYQIEGPYDKCKDFQLSDPKEYYSLIMVCLGNCAGAHKAGKFGSDDDIKKRLSFYFIDSKDPAAWGCKPSASTGPPIADVTRAINTGYTFISSTAKVLYPAYVATTAFQEKFTRVMMTVAAYRAEIEYAKQHNVDYIALGHLNMNMDNAYFWRDEDGVLDCGGLDWGGFGVNSLAHKIWWSLNCADFENTFFNFDAYLTIVLDCYERSGGPVLDRAVFREHVILTGLQNFLQMVQAVPNAMRMCPAKEWATIKDRHDPRIAGDIDDKSTLRTTIHAIGCGIRLMEEMQGAEVLDAWIENFYRGELGLTPKTDAVIGLV